MTNVSAVGKGWEDEVKIIRKSPTKLANTEILETTHYEWFKMDLKNRPISSERVNAFAIKFKKGHFFMKDFPAIVAGDYTIIDGQHRFEACRLLKLPFYFRVASDVTMENVIEIQTNSGWTPADYIHAYIQQKNQNYVVLQRFMKRYGMTASIAINMIKFGRSSMNENGFYSGTLTISDKEEAAGHAKCKMAIEIASANPNIKVIKDSYFLRAVRQITDHPEYDHKRMMDQMKKWPSLLMRQVGTKAYVLCMENIYNYKLYTKNRIRFEDQK